MASSRKSRSSPHSGLVLLSLAAGLIITLMPAPARGQAEPGALTITRLHYGGGGDWYADPSSLPNLIAYTRKQTGIRIAPEEVRAAIGDDTFWDALISRLAERDVYEQVETDRRDSMGIEEYWERSEPIEEAYYQEFRRNALDRLRLTDG